MKPDVMTVDEAAAHLKKTRATLGRWRSLGQGPIWRKSGSRVLYLKSSVVDYARRPNFVNPFDDLPEQEAKYDGNSVTASGVMQQPKPDPVRPANVPKEAVYVRKIGAWEHGSDRWLSTGVKVEPKKTPHDRHPSIPPTATWDAGRSESSAVVKQVVKQERFRPEGIPLNAVWSTTSREWELDGESWHSDGTKLDREPIPERPHNVPVDATWDAEQALWYTQDSMWYGDGKLVAVNAVK
jgi:hypothetical protein